jgi:predicted small lipoprotein YifL
MKITRPMIQLLLLLALALAAGCGNKGPLVRPDADMPAAPASSDVPAPATSS